MTKSVRFSLAVSAFAISWFACGAVQLYAAPGISSDFDGDGDSDNVDLTILLSNFWLSPAIHSDGDANGDSIVDSSDFDIAKFDFGVAGLVGGYNGTLASDPNPAQLIYAPTTGAIRLDQSNAPGGIITSFVLQSNSAFAALNVFLLPFSPTTHYTATSSIIAQTDPSDPGGPYPPTGFPSSPHLLGALLPTGLDLASLQAVLPSAVYVGQPGTGVRQFQLVVVPEPAAAVLAMIAAATIAAGRVPRRRGASR
jgi:hypothetical protein